MNISNPGKDLVISACIILLQLSICCIYPACSLSTDSRSLTSKILPNTQRVIRNNPSSTKNYPKNETTTEPITPTNESFTPTIADFPALKMDVVNGGLSTSKGHAASPIKSGLQEAEQFASPLNIDTFNSDSVENASPSSQTIADDNKTNSDDINGAQVQEDPSVDTKIEAEPFLTILVNSPPQIQTEAPEPSSVAPPKSADIPHAYPLVRAPSASSPYPITPLSLLPLEPAIPHLSSIPSSDKVLVSPSGEALNHSALTLENFQTPANLSVLPLNPTKWTKIELNSYAGQGALYKALPPFYGIIYPVSHSILPYPFSQQIQFDQPKNKPSNSYGPPRPTYAQHGNDNYDRPFGHPPTARALGFPPISNTHDNLRREVNWYRVGRSYH
ncbi:uncharacterized protein LOC130702312 [Daphnia carinata]|uniref:uncharacterized protein LOC130702312 n=1 Tax=Daphnia carinata TaxID=120202 RepID=UPI00257B3FA0|nr:uncharacterized protein LOC130702312 [Daphnia carinata]